MHSVRPMTSCSPHRKWAKSLQLPRAATSLDLAQSRILRRKHAAWEL